MSGTDPILTENAKIVRAEDLTQISFSDGRSIALDPATEAVLWGMVNRQSPNDIASALSHLAIDVDRTREHLGDTLVPNDVHPRSDMRFMAHLRTVCERLDLVQDVIPPKEWQGRFRTIA